MLLSDVRQQLKSVHVGHHEIRNDEIERVFVESLHGFLGIQAASNRHAAAGEQPIDPERYAQVKAAFVLNFLRFTQWPEEAFAHEESPILVVVLGDDAMTPYLRQLIRQERINDRLIVVNRLEYPRPEQGEYDVDERIMDEFYRRLGEAHLLYIARSEADRYSEVVEHLKGHPVLTVSDIDRFAERGGMLGLAVRENRVTFDAHPQRIRDCGLTVSSRVLRLARIVEDEQQEQVR
jgi:hypothetical protein